jgi:putative restriction endonuclease
MVKNEEVPSAETDWLIRQAAFMYLDELTVEHGETLPWEPLRDGFDFEGERVTLLGVRGIWKPRCLDLPISLRTSPQNPYGDLTGDDGLLHYRYYGTDIDHPDNAGLRSCYRSGLPLIYFAGVERGWYSPLWPMILVNDDPGTLTFTGACDDPQAVRSPGSSNPANEVRRQYVTRLALVRLHQARFRQVVLRAYRTACTVCQLGHMELLDAAHIVPDRTEVGGEPIVSNGLALCKIHHAAFDANILGIRPDYVAEIRSDVLAERDGPMLRYGIQEVHNLPISVPRSPADRPDRARLEIRYDQFRRAS